MLSSFLLFLVGLAALLVGGYLVVEGASSLARAVGVSPLVIGLTVVAFGTSAPELAVNLAAAITGRSEISFGNVIGSNIANIGLILGLAASVRILDIKSQLVGREIPMMLLATAAAAIMALDARLGTGSAQYDRGEGVLLLLFFSVFLYALVGDVLRGRSRDPLLEASGESTGQAPRWSALKSSAVGAAGLVALVVGSNVAVNGATGLSAAAGVPVAVIGLSVVAVGTSLPELVTSLVAAVRREADLAVGNIVGSNIFNLLFIMGVTATVRPTPVPSSGHLDIGGVAAFSLLLFLFSITDDRCIVRRDGVILLLLWAAFLAWRFGLIG